ncbi:MAG: SGNH/GDSL hydrolase family protein [Anaerobacillus sp.]
MKKAIKVFMILLVIIIIAAAGYVYLNPGSMPELINTLPVSKDVVDEETEDSAPAVQETKDIHVVGLGDSLTKGVGDKDKKGYIGYVSDQYFETNQDKNVILDNFAITGSETEDLLNRLEEENVQESIKEADYIFLTIGGNDLFGVVKSHFLNLDQQYFTLQKKIYVENLTSIFKEIRSLNEEAPIYFPGLFNPFSEAFHDIPEMNEIVDRWNEASTNTVSDFSGVTFVPIADLFLENEDRLLYEDAFHPNEDGYHLMGNRIMSYLEDNNVALK